MVSIPTSRDVGYAGTRSGRIAPNGPTPMIGAAMVGAGQQLVQAAYNLNDLRTQEQADALNDRSNAVSTNLNKFLNDEEQRFLAARDSTSESGIGFTRQFIEGYQQRADAFAEENFKGLNDDAQTGYLNNILARGNSLFEKATAHENTVKTAYYDRSTNTSLNGIRTSIQANGAPFADLKKQGIEAIDATNMPEPWKAERRAQWDADAAESKWKWKFANNPRQALDEISGKGGSDPVLLAMEDVESSGNPNALSGKGAAGLMQVMPDTGGDIAKALGDSAFPINGTDAEKQAYLKNPEVSRRYGETYYKQLLGQYDGDREAALIAYNGGQTRADAWLAAGRDDSVIPKESADYYKKVLGSAKINTYNTQDVSAAKVFLQSRTGKDATHIDGMQDGFAVKLSRMMQAAPPEVREALTINSGARSNERQAELWKDALAKYGSIDEARRWVAPPGRSEHNKGDAADLGFGSDAALQWAHANAAQFGLKFPLSNENWHIEDVNTRGGKAQPYDPDLAAIPADKREQLYRQGEQEYAQEQTRQRTAIKDDFSLQIAQNPHPALESAILRNGVMDNGDKAALINSLHSAIKENAGVPEFIQAIGAGKGSVNPFDNEQTKVAEKAYDKMVTGTEGQDKQVITSGFIAQTGYIPKAVQADLRRGSISTDAASVAQSMQAADVLQKNAPISFSAMEGGAGVQKKLDLYRAYTRDMGYSADEAARRLVDADNPEKAAQREALLKSKTVVDAVKLVDSSTIASTFDDSVLGWRSNPSLGPTPAAEASMVSDYRSLYQEAIVDANGDLTVAKKAADERFKRIYGVTSMTPMGSNVIVKYPPEKAYPAAPDGTHTYIQDQLNEVMKAEGVQADQFYLQPDEITGQDVRAGKPPRYAVFYRKDGKLERFNLPFYADPEAAQKHFQNQKEIRVLTSQQRMVENRDRTIAEGKAVDDAIASTPGPDWMKARAAQTAQEKLRMQEMMPGPLNPSTAGVGGGGGGF